MANERLEQAADRLYTDLARHGVQGLDVERHAGLNVSGIGLVDAPILVRFGGKCLIVEVHGLDGRLSLDVSAFTPELSAAEFATAQRTILSEFSAAVRTGISHELDVHRGVHLQRLIADAARQLAGR